MVVDLTFDFVKMPTETAGAIQAIASLMAVVVGFVSLVIAYRTFVIQQRHNELSILPILEIDVSQSESHLGYTTIQLVNRGNGIARIKRIRLHLADGECVSLRKFYDICDEELDEDILLLGTDDVIVPGEERKVTLFRAKTDFAKTAKMTATYRDAYKNHYTTKTEILDFKTNGANKK